MTKSIHLITNNENIEANAHHLSSKLKKNCNQLKVKLIKHEHSPIFYYLKQNRKNTQKIIFKSLNSFFLPLLFIRYIQHTTSSSTRIIRRFTKVQPHRVQGSYRLYTSKQASKQATKQPTNHSKTKNCIS